MMAKTLTSARIRSLAVDTFIFLLIVISLAPGGFVQSVVGMDAFSSSLHVFEYAFQHQFLFGTDLIDNVGPFGFLHYPYYYNGGYFWSKILIYWLNLTIFAYFSVKLLKQLISWPEKILFIVTLVFFPLNIRMPWFSFEIIPRLAMLFSALYFLTNDSEENKNKILPIIVVGFYYAFLILEKSSNVYYIFLTICVCSIYWMITKKKVNCLWLLGAVSCGVILFWVAASGSPLGLLDYFQSMRQFIDAYQGYYSSQMPGVLFNYALFYVALSLFFVLGRLFFSYYTKNHTEIFRLILIATMILLSWKHGIMRGKDSYGIILCIMPCIFSCLYFFPIGNMLNKQIKNKGVINLFSVYFKSITTRCILFMMLLFIFFANLAQYDIPKNSVLSEFTERLTMLIHYHPIETIKRLDAALISLQHQYAIPKPLKDLVQISSVDEFGDFSELILLNKLSYHPRPVPVHYIVGNWALNEKNGRYYQNIKTAPDFIFCSADLGFSLTDTKAYLSLLLNYSIQAQLGNEFVLKKHTNAWQQIAFKTLSKSKTHLGEWNYLNQLPPLFLWAEINIKPSLLGQLKNTFYKSDNLTLELKFKNGEVTRYRASLSQLQAGFLISPIIKSTLPMQYAYSENKNIWRELKAFRVIVEPEKDVRFFNTEMKVAYSEIMTADRKNNESRKNNFIPLSLDHAREKISFFDKQFHFKFKPTQFPVNLLTEPDPADLYTTGLANVESNGKKTWRWAVGPKTKLIFYLDKSEQHLLQLRLKNSLNIPNQTISILCNGKQIYSSSACVTKDDASILLPIHFKKGINTICILYNDWNHKQVDYARHDNRQLSVLINEFEIKDLKVA